MPRNGFNVGHVIRHPVFLITFLIAVPAWLVAFISQCAAEAQLDIVGSRQPVVRFLWYNIWIQLACIIHLFMAVCTDSLAVHRFQLAVVLAIAEVFAVFGSEFIFSTASSLKAVGAGWLLLTLVDLIWLLYLTSEEDSPFYRIFTAGGNGGMSGYSRRARAESTATGYGESGMARQNGGGYGGYGYTPTGVDSTPQKATREEYSQPLNQPTHPMGTTMGQPLTQSMSQPLSAMTDSAEPPKARAKAMYAYSADPADPNEVSFNKGDMLEVLDNTGKWFQVKTPSGQTGIAPSNYLTLL